MMNDRIRKKIISVACITSLVGGMTLTSCGSSDSPDKTSLEKKAINVEYSDRDLENGSKEDESIILKDSEVSSTSDDVSFNDKIVTIKKKGTYKVSGKLSDGQIKISVGDSDKVQLLLDNATVNCSFGPAIYSESADKVFIQTVKGTKNTVSDKSGYKIDDEETGAAIFAKCSLTLNGEGELNVNGNNANGIETKDNLKVTSGTVNVKSAKAGIKGKDSVAIKDGTLDITSEGDGIKSTKEDEDNEGYVSLEGGNIVVNSGTDGISAESVLQAKDGKATITSAGGCANAKQKKEQMGMKKENTEESTKEGTDNDSNEVSAKGLKAGQYVLLLGGEIGIDSMDDAIHSNGSVLVNDGKFVFKTGDDGIHADELAYMNGGNVTVANSYEGIEGKNIIVDKGDINITSSDDGLNVAGGNDSSGMGGIMGNDGGMAPPQGGPGQDGDNTNGAPPQGGPGQDGDNTNGAPPQGGPGQDGDNTNGAPPQGGPGQDGDNTQSEQTTSSDMCLEINGGTIKVNAEGDGLDSNGDILVTGGNVYVDGPTNGGNGAIDHGDGCSAIIKGGTVIAIGAKRMAVNFSSSSEQASIMYNANGNCGDTVLLSSQDGTEIIKHTAAKKFENVVISTPNVKSGEKYILQVGENKYDVSSAY